MATLGFYTKGIRDGCHDGLLFGVGGIQVQCIFGMQDFKLV